MDNIIDEFNNLCSIKINEIYDNHKILLNQYSILEKNNLQLIQENNNLNIKISELIQEKKLKLSSTIWESTQIQLKEKDLLIEQLKKDNEFYKRNLKTSKVSDVYLSNSQSNFKNNNVEDLKNVEENEVVEIVEEKKIKVKKEKSKKEKSEKKKKKINIEIDELEKELLNIS